MTFEEVMAATATSFDRQIADEIERAEILLADNGFSDVEIAEIIARHQAEVDGWKADCLAEIRAGLLQTFFH